MSQSHIPQPDAAGVAPSEEFVSTASAPHGPGVSTIEVPGLPPVEMVSHMGQMNNIDPYWYQQFRWVATIPWTTSDAGGKLLWWTPISPLGFDKYLAWQMQLYLAWAGDFEVNMKIAGTGFHAGLLSIVTLPPTIHPTDITSAKGWTIYPWDAFDPKMLEITTVTGRDKRPIAYHYVRKQDNAPPDYYIGGYLALFVDMPLNTSSSGSQKIEVNIWARPAPNFGVSWVTDPYAGNIGPALVPPPELEYMLNFNVQVTQQTLSSAPMLMDKVIVQPAKLKELTYGVYNCFSLDGKPMSNYTPETFFEPNTGWIGKYENASADHTTGKITDLSPFWHYLPVNQIGFALTSDKHEEGKSIVVTGLTTGETRSITGHIMPANAKMEEAEVCCANMWPNSKVMPGITDKPYSAKTKKESFLTFASGTNENYSVQFIEMTKLFLSGKLKGWLPTNSCALFMMYDAQEELPIGYAKLYEEGFFTTKAIEGGAKYLSSHIRFTFAQFIARTDEIPGSVQESQNRLLVTMKHASLIRTSERPSRKHRQLALTHGSSSSTFGSSGDWVPC